MEYSNCGKLGEVVDTRFGNTWYVATVTATVVSVIVGLATADYSGIFNGLIDFLGISVMGGFVIIGVTVLIITVGVFYYLWKAKCDEPEGSSRCATGVVNAIHGEDLGVFPFAADHPNIDLVIKSKYWSLIELGAVKNIFCSGANSPVLKVFYKSPKVCGAASGAVAGSFIGGTGGVIGGAIAATAIGCATVWLCALAIFVLLVIIVAAAVAGAWAGSAIGAATAEGRAIEATDGRDINVGDYMKATGPTAIYNEFEGAMVQYFNEDTELFGRTSELPPYSHEIPDNGIPEVFDC